MYLPKYLPRYLFAKHMHNYCRLLNSGGITREIAKVVEKKIDAT